MRVNSIHELPQVLTVAIMTILCHSRCVRDDVFHSIAYICAKVVSSTMSQSTTSMVTEHTHTHTQNEANEKWKERSSLHLSPRIVPPNNHENAISEKAQIKEIMNFSALS